MRTALRETHEELGVDPEAVEVLGVLPPVRTRTQGRRIDPVVGLERVAVEPRPDGYEVAACFRIALARLLEAPLVSRRLPGLDVPPVHFIEVDNRVVWGATAAIVVELLERIRAV